MEVDESNTASDSSLLRAWNDVRVLNSREYDSLAKEMDLQEIWKSFDKMKSIIVIIYNNFIIVLFST